MTAGKIRRKQRGDGRQGVSVAGAAVIRKYIINTNFITFYDKTNLYVRILNHTIPVGRTFKKELENHLLY